MSPEAELLLADDSQRRGSAVISTFKTSLKCSRFNKNIKKYPSAIIKKKESRAVICFPCHHRVFLGSPQAISGSLQVMGACKYLLLSADAWLSPDRAQRRPLTESSWCSTSSTASPPSSSCTGSSCWLRASTRPAPSRSFTASSRPPSVDAASAEWYVQTWWLPQRGIGEGCAWIFWRCLCVRVSSLCSWRTFWAWPGWACLASPPCQSSSSTTCGPPAPPWSPPTSPTSTPSA